MFVLHMASAVGCSLHQLTLQLSAPVVIIGSFPPRFTLGLVMSDSDDDQLSDETDPRPDPSLGMRMAEAQVLLDELVEIRDHLRVELDHLEQELDRLNQELALIRLQIRHAINCRDEITYSLIEHMLRDNITVILVIPTTDSV